MKTNKMRKRRRETWWNLQRWTVLGKNIWKNTKTTFPYRHKKWDLIGNTQVNIVIFRFWQWMKESAREARFSSAWNSGFSMRLTNFSWKCGFSKRLKKNRFFRWLSFFFQLKKQVFQDLSKVGFSKRLKKQVFQDLSKVGFS